MRLYTYHLFGEKSGRLCGQTQQTSWLENFDHILHRHSVRDGLVLPGRAVSVEPAPVMQIQL